MTAENPRDEVMSDALRLTTAINRHLKEENCVHSLSSIMKEAFSQNEN